MCSTLSSRFVVQCVAMGLDVQDPLIPPINVEDKTPLAQRVMRQSAVTLLPEPPAQFHLDPHKAQQLFARQMIWGGTGYETIREFFLERGTPPSRSRNDLLSALSERCDDFERAQRDARIFLIECYQAGLLRRVRHALTGVESYGLNRVPEVEALLNAKRYNDAAGALQDVVYSPERARAFFQHGFVAYGSTRKECSTVIDEFRSFFAAPQRETDLLCHMKLYPPGAHSYSHALRGHLVALLNSALAAGVLQRLNADEIRSFPSFEPRYRLNPRVESELFKAT